MRPGRPTARYWPAPVDNVGMITGTVTPGFNEMAELGAAGAAGAETAGSDTVGT